MAGEVAGDRRGWLHPTETVPAVPMNPYGQSKLAVDHLLAVPAGRRPSVEVYGTDYPTPGGTAVRVYLHVVDLGEAHLAALQAVQPGQHPATP